MVSNNPRVYIPSRGRPENVEKLVKAWYEEIFDVYFMVEPDEFDAYQAEVDKAGAGDFTTVMALPDRNLGVGFSRSRCMEHAANDGHESVIMSDDDIKPNRGRKGEINPRMDKMIELCEDPFVLGATAYYSYQDLMFGIKGKDRLDVILCPTCVVRMFGLNVKNSLEIGNFDPLLKCGDDVDFQIRGLMAGFPWLVYLGAKAQSFGPRFAEGGVKALEDATGEELGEDDPANRPKPAQGENTKFAVQRLHDKFPEMTNIVSPVKITFYWRKMHDEYLPDWRHYSALQGGNIKNYMGPDWEPPS